MTKQELIQKDMLTFTLDDCQQVKELTDSPNLWDGVWAWRQTIRFYGKEVGMKDLYAHISSLGIVKP